MSSCFMQISSIKSLPVPHYCHQRNHHKHCHHHHLHKHIWFHNQSWLDIYHRYISLIYIGYISQNIGYFLYFRFLSIFFQYFLMWHIVTTFWFSVCVFCWLMTCAISIFSALDNFCQIAPLHNNAVWMTRVLHLIWNAHTHTYNYLVVNFI